MTEVLNPIVPVEEQINQELVKANVTESIIASLKEKYLPLKINGIDDKETYILVKDARKECKGLRVMAEKICKKGREDAVAIQKAWVATEKEVAGKIGEVEDYLEKEEKGYEALVEKDKADRKRKQEEQFILRQAELSKMGVLYSDGNFTLNEVSFEMSLIKECEVDVWDEAILPKYKTAYALVEAERAEQERLKSEREAEIKRQQEELESNRRKLEEREQAIKKAEEAARLAEEKRISDAAFEERQRVEKLWRSRLEMLRPIGWNSQEAFAKYDESVIVATYEQLVSWNDEEFFVALENHKANVVFDEQIKDKKRQEEIEEQKRIAAEEAVKKEREIAEKLQKDAELKRQQEEARKAEELAQSSDKDKWNDILDQLGKLDIHEMRSGQYRKKIAMMREKMEEIKAL